jgi:hypothetical protein
VPSLLSPNVAVAEELAMAGAAALAEPTAPVLAERIAALLVDEDARRALAERGRAVVPARYGRPAAARGLAEAYASVVAGAQR